MTMYIEGLHPRMEYVVPVEQGKVTRKQDIIPSTIIDENGNVCFILFSKMENIPRKYLEEYDFVAITLELYISLLPTEVDTILFYDEQGAHELNLRGLGIFEESRYFGDEKYQEASRMDYKNTTFVQAHINNCKCIPTSVDELCANYTDGYCEMDDLLQSDSTCWTVPKWSKKGDIVFFMVQKDMVKPARRLKRELIERRNEFTATAFAQYSKFVDRFVTLIERYHGKIIAVGRVANQPNFDLSGMNTHWKSTIYADVAPVVTLDYPVDIADFCDEIRVSRQSAYTGIFGTSFDFLKTLIGVNNVLPEFLKTSQASPLPYKTINRENWLRISNEYRRSFLLEAQFRAYYTDYLLDELRDLRKRRYGKCTIDAQSMEELQQDITASSDDESAEAEDSGSIIDKIENSIKHVKGSATSQLKKAKNILSNMIDLVAIMIVTECVLPFLVLLFLFWLAHLVINVILQVPDTGMTKMLKQQGKLLESLKTRRKDEGKIE